MSPINPFFRIAANLQLQSLLWQSELCHILNLWLTLSLLIRRNSIRANRAMEGGTVVIAGNKVEMRCLVATKPEPLSLIYRIKIMSYSDTLQLDFHYF